MKKVGILLILFLILTSAIVYAQNETLTIEEKAAECLDNQIEDDCENLESVEDLALVLLAVGDCRSELNDLKHDDDCWPTSSCRVKDTAMAIIALDGVSDAEDWLLDNKKVPAGLDWFMQVDSDEATTCDLGYDSTTKQITIDEAKKLSTDVSLGCFEIYEDYWLKIKDICLDKNLTVSCDQDFVSTLMYKQPNEEVWYLSSQTKSASALGETEHDIEFYCFSKPTADCKYEDNLWAAFALQEAGHDISGVLPYLEVFAEDNEGYFPESFLQILTNNYLAEVLSLETSGYWDIGRGKYYDTALAILSLKKSSQETSPETINWLELKQGEDGCWNNGNIRDTSFLLWAGWGETGLVSGGSGGGTEESCLELGGKTCELGEVCDVLLIDALDTNACCLGDCVPEVEQSECEQMNYDCRSSCFSSEEETSEECDDIGDVCCKSAGGDDEDYGCIEDGNNCRFSCFSYEEEISGECPEERTCCASAGGGGIEPKKSYAWVWVLIVLIILAVLGIIFRAKLRVWLYKFKGKFKKGPVTKTGPRFPPARRPMGLKRMAPRVFTQRRAPARAPVRRPAPVKSRVDSELEETIKKLKEIGK